MADDEDEVWEDVEEGEEDDDMKVAAIMPPPPPENENDMDVSQPSPSTLVRHTSTLDEEQRAMEDAEDE